jgi:hypothetical protein
MQIKITNSFHNSEAVCRPADYCENQGAATGLPEIRGEGKQEMKTQLKRTDGTLIDESDMLTFKELVVKNKANLTWADLTRADLDGANLNGANLTRANLTRADIDYSAWPLSCGTYNVKVDKNIAAQLAMHFCWLNCDDPEVKAAQEAVKTLAMKCKHWKKLPDHES